MNHLTEQDISALQENESGKDMPKTPEQIEAIYRTGTNILVSASAGSGQTFVMTERILYYILKGVPLKSLFISTFTNKAAAELKKTLKSSSANTSITRFT